MKYFRDSITNSVYAFELDGSQDGLITASMKKMTANEIDRHVNPEKYFTAKQKRQHYLENLAPITKRQFKLILLEYDLLNKVQSVIDSIPDETARMKAQIEYEDAQTFERLNPTITSLYSAMGLKESEVDTLWEKALKL